MKTTERNINAPQGINARRVEATIIEKMPADTWLTVTQTSQLIRAEESRTRARLNRLVREGKIERKRDQGNQREVYLFRKPS
jgi:DNA-binding MarR family transcriptional regulator